MFCFSTGLFLSDATTILQGRFQVIYTSTWPNAWTKILVIFIFTTKDTKHSTSRELQGVSKNKTMVLKSCYTQNYLTRFFENKKD